MNPWQIKVSEEAVAQWTATMSSVHLVPPQSGRNEGVDVQVDELTVACELDGRHGYAEALCKRGRIGPEGHGEQWLVRHGDAPWARWERIAGRVMVAPSVAVDRSSWGAGFRLYFRDAFSWVLHASMWMQLVTGRTPKMR